MPYHIVCIANEAYAQHAAVMLASLVDHNREALFRVFILTDGMAEGTEERLLRVVDGHGELSVHKVDAEGMGLLALKSETSTKAWNPIMYLKLVIPQVLPEEVNRFLFLDVDLVVNHDISGLYDTDLQGGIVAACDDYRYQAAHRARLQLNDEDLYVNSGVMVVDLQAWRKWERKRPMMEFLRQYKDVMNNDQDGFALYFKGMIRLLPNRWNVTTFYFEQQPRVLDKYMGEVDDLRRNPYIVHFCEPVKPWFRDCHHPYRHLYRRYLALTPWAGYRFPYAGDRRSWRYWKSELKYWLNRLGLRRDPMALVGR
ncbi:MAG: glycosyltransferase family 8 protein [Bacteroidaceae bacterium]